MMPARSVARSPSPASRRSILQRIKAPFGGKARHWSEFYIQPDDPHRVYGPGDVITGSVVLKASKPFTVTHIVVCLHGYSQVYKTPNSPGEGYKQYNAILVGGKTRKSGGYYGNGFVSLFEDEITLCGDGRLGEGTYQFNFELVFPRAHLPSSIEFERGTVSYMITATMTRPTAISPTTTCDRTVNFQEDIDVAPLSQPKPRVITLEPIIRRSRTKHRRKKAPGTGAENRPAGTGPSDLESRTTESTAVANDRVIDIGGSQVEDPPQSPVPSDVSFDSCMSSGGTGSAIDSAAPSARTSESRHNSGKSTTHASGTSRKKPITATVEIQRAGFLRGDTIPIKIWVTHTRAVKSLRGVIATLYRQARVDMHPALLLVKGGDDDVYPKSRTGLSGLSLSSAGSTHTFRKDLDQQFASLIVNPATLAAEIKANLRVPEEAFPSIASVPGAMISFKYYVEIVLDLQGKLANLDRFLPNAGAAIGGSTGRPSEGTGGVYTPWGGHFINTEEIRRDKSVVYSVFEVVVGTRDSERRSPWKQPETDGSTITGREDFYSNAIRPENMADSSEMRSNGELPHDGHRPLSWDQYWQHHPPDHHDEPPPTVHFPPPPTMEDESQLGEKERMRRAEARLMPSAPPDAGETSATASLHAPSAPLLLEEQPPLPPLPLAPSDFDASGPSVPSLHTVRCLGEEMGPSAPAYDHSEIPTSSTHHQRPESSAAPAYDHSEVPAVPVSDEKEDVRRRRLESERSAPPDHHGGDEDAEDGVASAGVSLSVSNRFTPSAPSAPPSRPAAFAPSAPVLTEEDFLGGEADPGSGMPAYHALPRYER